MSEAGLNIDEYLAVANTEPFTPEEEEPPTPTSSGAPATNTSVSSHRTASVTKSDSTAGKVSDVCTVVISAKHCYISAIVCLPYPSESSGWIFVKFSERLWNI